MQGAPPPPPSDRASSKTGAGGGSMQGAPLRLKQGALRTSLRRRRKKLHAGRPAPPRCLVAWADRQPAPAPDAARFDLGLWHCAHATVFPEACRKPAPCPRTAIGCPPRPAACLPPRGLPVEAGSARTLAAPAAGSARTLAAPPRAPKAEGGGGYAQSCSLRRR